MIQIGGQITDQLAHLCYLICKYTVCFFVRNNLMNLKPNSLENLIRWHECAGSGSALFASDVPMIGCYPKQWNRLSWRLTHNIKVNHFICCISVHACNVDHCWEESQTAYQILTQESATTGIKEPDIRCISLRTYMQCLVELQGCKGNIKFHSVKKVIRNQMNQYQCNSSGEVYTGSPITFLPPDELCTYHGTKTYKHCGLFGDPHIRTFDNQFQTCSIQGAWPLIDNDHLTVQVTNEVVSQASKATATTKVSISLLHVLFQHGFQ
jgi:hypothetical protein